MDPQMNNLLKWSIQNSTTAQQDTTNHESSTGASSNANSTRGLNPEMLAALFGGPSDAELMKSSMAALHSPDVDLANKLIAFDNFEQLIETIDNANNLEPLGLWTPLVQLLKHDEPDMRRMAAWCIGTAVQNNEKAQDKLVVMNTLPVLVEMAMMDEVDSVRRKAVYALSSAVRNFQPALDEVVKCLRGKEDHPLHRHSHGEIEKIDAGDMDAVDGIMDRLRSHRPVPSDSV